MEEPAPESNQPMTAKQLSLMFVFFFLGNCIVVYLAHRLFPNDVVLGTYFHTPLMALVSSMTALTLVTTGSAPVVESLIQVTKAKLTEPYWIISSFLLNLVSVWVIARFASMFGMGVSSWGVVAILAIILGLSQRVLVKTIVNRV